MTRLKEYISLIALIVGATAACIFFVQRQSGETEAKMIVYVNSKHSSVEITLKRIEDKLDQLDDRLWKTKR